MKLVPCFAILCVALIGCNKQGASTAAAGQQPSETSSKPKAEPVALAAKTYDGPFGLAGAMSVAELERMGFKSMSEAPNLYIGKPPKPFADAENYAVLATPKTGVCRIMTRVSVPVVNGSGDQLKEKTDQLAETMAVKYGKYSEKVDYIKQDVYRRNPQFWLMGLREDSVVYAYDWSAGKTTKPLPGDLENIEIVAESSSTDSGEVVIKYTFANFKDCRKDMQAKKADNL